MINANNAQRVANVMQYQLDIDKALRNKTALPPAPDLRDLPTKNGLIQWVKNSSGTPAFSGYAKDYISQREKGTQ